MAGSKDLDRQGRVIALTVAGIALGWLAMTAIGGALGWTQHTRLLFDLAALAGFGWAIWMIYGLWRERQKHKD